LQQDIDREILKALNSSNTAPDVDEVFFISVIPAVRRMSEEKKLDFHMSVLQLKDVNNRRKERPVFETTFSSASTSTSQTKTPLSSLSAIMDAKQVNQLPHLLQADQFYITQNVIVALIKDRNSFRLHFPVCLKFIFY